MTTITIKDEERFINLGSEVFAQSAIDNDIDLDSFTASLNNFSDKSVSPIALIYAWRDEAVDYYVDHMVSAGKLKFVPETALGKKIIKNIKKGETNNGKLKS